MAVVLPEQAPGVLKALGVQAIVAKSFARIFYRNAINIGLPVIVCKELPDEVKTGDTMELSMSDGTAQAMARPIPAPSCRNICRIF